MNLFNKLFRTRDEPKNLYHFSGWPFTFGKFAVGKNVNEFTAMQTTAVYACVRILAESIGVCLFTSTHIEGKGKSVCQSILSTFCSTMCRIQR